VSIWNQHSEVYRQQVASNDRQVAENFMFRYESNPETFRLYRREVERLLLWMNCVAQRTLKTLTLRDLQSYKPYFLNEDKQAPIKNRLLQSTLSENSVNLSLRVINSFFSYLMESHYIDDNPMYGIAMQSNRSDGDALQPAHHLDALQFSFILQEVEKLPYETEKQQAEAERLRFLLSLFQFIGAGISYLEQATHHAFVHLSDKWWFNYTARAGNEFCIEVNDHMLNALTRFRRFHGLTPLPSEDETEIPLLPNLYIGENAKSGRKTGITARRVRQLIKTLFLKAMVSMEEDGFEEKADGMQHASLHAIQSLGRQKLIE